jgi:antitoxin MazE
MKTTLQRWGNSQGVRIPKPIIDSLGLEPGVEVDVSLSEDRAGITITPAKDARPVRGRYRIGDLAAASDPAAFEDGELDWGEPQGREVW